MKRFGFYDKGQVQRIEVSLAHMKPGTKMQREVLNATRIYFQNHGHKMDYPRYEAMGLHIGSGIAEAACKLVIQTRFKRCGMRWSRNGAERLLKLRQTYLNNQWGSLLQASRN
jgi:hypothetical protein